MQGDFLQNFGLFASRIMAVLRPVLRIDTQNKGVICRTW